VASFDVIFIEGQSSDAGGYGIGDPIRSGGYTTHYIARGDVAGCLHGSTQHRQMAQQARNHLLFSWK